MSLGSPYGRAGSAAPPPITGSGSFGAGSYPVGYAGGSPVPGGRRGVPGGALGIVAVVVILVLIAALVALAIADAGVRHRLTSTRSSLRATRAQLAAVTAALSTDTKALVGEQQVGAFMRGVRDDLAPALAAYGASGNAADAAAASADDEQAIAALTSAKQKIADLTLPDALRSAAGDIGSAMEALSNGLESEVKAIRSQNLSGLDSALTAEGDALERLQSALGEMYSAVGTTGPAAAAS